MQRTLSKGSDAPGSRLGPQLVEAASQGDTATIGNLLVRAEKKGKCCEPGRDLGPATSAGTESF